MSETENDAIFWVETSKIKPNPYQPRREFDEARLNDLAESIRQYGVLQPLVVTRQEQERPDGGLESLYELIAGERRLRAARIANVFQIPVIIRSSGSTDEDERTKLEIAIVENVQREDLNPIERARAFKRLIDEFKFKHTQVAKKIGKSREYVSNSVRLLSLPKEIVEGMLRGEVSEGHARPLMMLSEKPEEQTTLYKEIIIKKLNVRESERIARHIAHDRARKRTPDLDPEILELENKLTENIGARVQIDFRETGSKVTIDFQSVDDLRSLLSLLEERKRLEGGDPGKGKGATGGEEDLYSVSNFTI